MRNINRIDEVLNTIREIWRRNPDLRLMQLLCNAVGDGPWVYYIEEEKLLEALEKCYEA